MEKASPEPVSEGEVSVVITTYNHAHYLGEAIQSARAQSVPPAEIIVVDDGSTDHPETVVREISSVILIRQENRGLPSARNTGWAAARGEFVVFLDADDRLLPNALEVNLSQIRRSPGCGFVYGIHRKIDAAGEFIRNEHLKPVGDDAYAALLERNVVTMHGTVMYSRRRIEAVGGFDPALPACEDYDLYLRMARQYPVACCSEIIAEYRRHESNMSYDAPRMLRTALSVLRRQKSDASARPEWRKAWRRGIREWKRYYAGEQIEKVRNADNPSPRLIRDCLAMSCLAPLTFQRAAMEDWRNRRRSSP